ncbi:MAG: type II toxin-antitoxin system VapC family toxin [gamma proteobacterium endosymbiont of Lamellibrachia anaximandri]|nr:type II toxin-antitoxin system VapC family toxin [gamma proteobacterium endosymbiont of Lamellibrachia anaximandri]MBL3535772.1 type II toxin-antitoxin system VapC family toxin [gamma proteobacterium endosymbiont of Lamellibrachia anaximandri]
MILLDTHALIWLDQGSDKLGRQSRLAIDTAFESDFLTVSAISFWEIAMLQSKGRLQMPPVRGWRQELLNNGLNEIPVDGMIGIASIGLPHFHPDPADRIIVATATHYDATLVTADTKILAWDDELKRIDARS